MKLSIIIVCLNEEKHLSRCLMAIQKVHHAGMEHEVIVVDGGSADRSREIAKSFGVRLVVTPRGIPRQRNAGARAATGDILAYVDADVEILKGWFATVARHFAGDQDKILGCAPRLAEDASWVARTFALHWGLLPDAQMLQDGLERLLSTQSLVMGRKVFERVGGFSEDLEVDEDTVFLLQAKQQSTPIAYDTELAYIHHGEPTNLGEFFRRITWGSNFSGWRDAMRRGEFAQVLRPQYIYGTVIGGELLLMVLSLLAQYPERWGGGVPVALVLLSATVALPSLKTAARHKAYHKLGQLCVMYGTYGLASAAAMLGLGRDKAKRWR
jgi:glycosyltransferase involved in cell wall biosynthesis